MKNIFEEWRMLEEQKLIEYNVSGKNILLDPRFDIFLKKDSKGSYSISILSNYVLDEELDIDMYGIVVKTMIDKDVDNNKKSIVIQNTNSNNIDIFMAFSSSLYEKAVSNPNLMLFDLIRETLNDYKEYFKGTKNILSDVEQQGLFGELYYILEHIEENPNIIKNWEGVHKNKHDFVFENNSVEIKTTKNQTRLDIRISNENQLDNSYVDKLELVVYRLEKIAVGKTIYDLYNQILSKLLSKYINEFKAKMIKVGFNVNDLEGLCHFRLVERFDFVVNEDFPKIDKSNLLDRVFDVKYMISLDGLESKSVKYDC